jgi:hypothetical protein
MGDVKIYFVDVECLNANNNRKIIKELSILDFQSGKISTFHLYPPVDIIENDLSDKVKGCNNYLVRFRHGLSLNSGVVRYSTVKYISDSLFSKNRKYVIYIKGVEKLQLIKSVIKHDSICDYRELGVLRCPKFDLSLIRAVSERCLLHSNNKRHLYCTEAKVKYFADWFSDTSSFCAL